MTIDLSAERQIIDSWHQNARAWSVAISEQQIASRKLVTDRSIIDAVVSCNARKVLDIGCGEGWLTRELTARGMDVLGVDVVPAFINKSQTQGAGRFEVASYAEIAAGKLGEKFDLAVANFSLFGNESVTDLFRSIPSLLTDRGTVIVQTLHPLVVCGELPYSDGWRASSWAGFSDDFTDPAPWYFRTVATWVDLFTTHGFTIAEIREPLHPQTGKPAAAIFIGVVR
jgi:2-polyprenyl-3-methyl-5-hydroxy-6-metoxy-1,4-benzoquinol methylase